MTTIQETKCDFCNSQAETKYSNINCCAMCAGGVEEIIKPLRKHLTFATNCLKNFYPFKEYETGVPNGYSAEFYQTLSHAGDTEILEKFKECLKELEGKNESV